MRHRSKLRTTKGLGGDALNFFWVLYNYKMAHILSEEGIVFIRNSFKVQEIKYACYHNENRSKLIGNFQASMHLWPLNIILQQEGYNIKCACMQSQHD